MYNDLKYNVSESTNMFCHYNITLSKKKTYIWANAWFDVLNIAVHRINDQGIESAVFCIQVYNMHKSNHFDGGALLK